MHQLHALRLDSVLMHQRKDFHHSKRAVHKIAAALGRENPGGLPNHILQAAENLMAGDGLGAHGIDQPRAFTHIRGDYRLPRQRRCPKQT